MLLNQIHWFQERIAHFIIDLLKDSNHQELAFTSIKEMTKDKGQSSLSIKQLLMNYCRSQLFASIEQKKKVKVPILTIL